MKKIFLMLVALAATLTAGAQLAELQPRSMVQLDLPSTGDKNFANIEIVFDTPLAGAKLVRDNFSKPDKKKENTPTAIYVLVNAQEEPTHYARAVTVAHPDFVPCIIRFADLGISGRLNPGMTYRIDIAVPEADFVTANRAFAALDYDKAKEIYTRYVSSGNRDYATIATTRLELMQELAQQCEFVKAHKDETVHLPTKVRTMKAAQEIYEKTSSMDAYRVYSRLHKELIPRLNTDDEGVSEIMVAAVTYNPSDRQAFSDRTLELVNGSPHYSWIWVNLPLENATFDHAQLYKTPARIDGKYRVYVAPGAADSLIVNHPDCAPLVIKFADYGITEIKPASVYRVELMAPPSQLIEADRAFSTLDFNTAKMLYEDMLINYEQYDDTTMTTVDKRLNDVNHLIDKDYRGKWNRLRNFFVRRPTAERSELAAKADTMAAIARELDALKVPGMKRNIAFYTKRADEYRNSVFLRITAGMMNKDKHIVLNSDGKPKPITNKSIVLEYRLPSTKKRYPQTVYAAPAGCFSVYLPEEVSKWLLGHPGEELEIDVRNSSNGKEYKVYAGGASKFKVSLDSGERSINAPIFIPQK